MERATRVICEAPRPRAVDSTAPLRTVFETVRNDAVDAAVCCCSGLAARKSRASRGSCEGFFVFAWSCVQTPFGAC
eukprot:11178145-Lingulodinium_polyedra.AAC.1